MIILLIDLLPTLTFLATLISGVVIPIYLLLNKKFKSIDKQLMVLHKFLTKVADQSVTEDQQQNIH